MLKRLHVDNFKCLTNFEIKPEPISCLVGPNGGGKTATLDVLRAIQAFLQGGATVSECFSPASLTRWDRRSEQHFELEALQSDGTLYRYELRIVHNAEQRRSTVKREAVYVEKTVLYENVEGEIHLYGDTLSANGVTRFPSDPRRSFLPVIEPRPDNKLLSGFKQWVSGIWLFALRPFGLEGFSSGESPVLEPGGGNFASWFRWLLQERPGLEAQVRAGLDTVIPGLSGIRLQQVGPDAKLMQLDCELAGTSFSLGLHELSDGQRNLLMLYSVLGALASHASLLVLDEPDNFVAEAEIQPWLAQLREKIVAGKRGTLMVISHHHQVIDYLAADSAYLLDRSDGGPTQVKQVSVDLDTGMTASEWIRSGEADAQ